MSNFHSPAAPLRRPALALVPALFCLGFAHAAALAGKDLVSALQSGGYVIVMRHASSPPTPPEPAQANPDNVRHERQLDASGRAAAADMGAALRRLHVCVGQVLSSPTYRALETVRLANWGPPRTLAQLGDSGHSMASDSTGVRGNWLRSQVAEVPASGTNTIIVTHFPNIVEAFAQDAVGLGDGEALILHPDGHGAAATVARMKISEWSALAATH